jgi:signal transduction histidine kinase
VRIYRRLVLLVAVPLAVAVTFSVLALAPSGQQALQAHRLANMVEAAAAANELAYRLQGERTSATALVSGQGDEASFRKTANATGESVDAFRAERERLSNVPGNAQEALDRIDRSLQQLPTVHAQVRAGSSSLSALTFSYRIVIADLVAYREGIAQAEGVDADVADQIRASAALSEATEHMGQQQVTVLQALAGGGFTPASQRTFEATRLGYTESTGTMFDIGPQEWRTWLEKGVYGPKALTAQRLEDRVGRSQVNADLPISPASWQEATADRLSLLRKVERRIDDSVIRTVKDRRTELIWWAVAQAVLVLLTLVGTVFVASRLGRVMIRRLRHLRDAANDMAYRRLPQVTAELSQPGALSGATPVQVAERAGKAVTTTGEDEIGEVGEAFNSVHHEAVRLAAEQSDAQDQFAETLVTVARRGAQLTSVMVSELDVMQRDEATPERMKLLFALDHLANRMERNTNNLLVLGGSGHGRARSTDVPLSTVIMVAAQQIEQFGRVETGVVQPGIDIAARAVHDVAHILAELLDNATRYSPPEKSVGVAAWRLWDRAVVQVVDDGVGIKPERRAELNSTLSEPRKRIGGVRSMGLHVVAQLAARHGIGVELRASESPGTIVEIMLPAGVLGSAPRPEAPQLPQGAAAGREDGEASESASGAADGDGGTPARESPAPRADELLPAPGRGRQEPGTSGAATSDAWRSDHEHSAAGGDESRETARQHGGPNGSTRLGRMQRLGGRGEFGVPSTASRSTPGDPAPSPQGTEEHGGRREPQPAQTAGISAAGLPVRRRKQADGQQPVRARGEEGDGASASTAGTASKPRTSPPRRRDSRQISDVLTAYSQGINRSVSRRERSAPSDPRGPGNRNADDTQRNT